MSGTRDCESRGTSAVPLAAASLAGGVGLAVAFWRSGLTSAVSGALVVAGLVLAIQLAGRLLAWALTHRQPTHRPGRVGAVLLGVVSAVVALVTLVWGAQQDMMFPGAHDDADRAALQGLPGYSEVRFTGVDGVAYNGMLYQPSDAPNGLIVYFGGNGEVSYAKMALYAHGGDWSDLDDFAFLDVDYAGYGMNTGQASMNTIYAESLAVYDYATGLPGAARIVGMGFSIGTGAAVYLAAHRALAGLVLYAPYANGYDLYNAVLPIFHGPVRVLARYKLPSDQYAPQVTCPVLVVASRADQTVPFASSQRLAGLFAGDVSFYTVGGASHNEVPSAAGVPARVKAFLQQVTSQ